MNLRILTLCSLLLLAAPLLARDKTDVLVMKNGDRLTCEIKGLDSGVLYASLDYVDGTISLQWSKVAHVESKQLFIVKTEDGSVYTGALSTPETPAGRPVEIQVLQTPANAVKLERRQIVQIAGTSEHFWQRFNGAINTGLTYSKGNQSTQFNLGSQVAYPRERWAAEANFNSNLTSSTGTSAATRNQGGLQGLHLLPWNNWFYAGMGTFLQSSVQGINLQTNLGGGIGRYLKNTNRATITVVGGVAWQNTQYQQSKIPQPTQNVGAAMVGAEMKFFKFKKTNLNLAAAVFPALSDPGRVYFNTNAYYYIKLFSNFSWNVSFYGNWDNQPPPNFTGSDYGTSSGLSWTFGTR